MFKNKTGEFIMRTPSKLLAAAVLSAGALPVSALPAGLAAAGWEEGVAVVVEGTVVGAVEETVL